MMMWNLLITATTLVLAVATPIEKKPYTLKGRQYSSSNDSTVVDLGYAVYNGVRNSSTGVTSWLGMRYAASTAGKNRWQAPQPPETDRDEVKQADTYALRCPQGPSSPAPASSFNYTGSEDCLFLNVQTPNTATSNSKLPVLVSIHGGGYGQGQGNQDLTLLMNANNNSFIGVVIQYRLAAFGFLSSDEVQRFGTPNAGILDQMASLQWIQDYIHLFGGDPKRVTISGESAGGGSVMLLSMAYSGTLGTSLFSNAITASPYLPMQYGYADFVPSQSFYSFAEHAGCFNGGASGGSNTSVFECLVNKDTATLQAASSFTSSSGFFGSWGFLPVTDGELITQRPSEQLLEYKVNGVRMLTGNNANEGPGFVPQNITTEQDFKTYLHGLFPLFTDNEVAQVISQYPSGSEPDDPNDPKYATSGDIGATAVNVSTYGTGHQQRANNVYAESIFACPSYWLAEAYSTEGRKSYKYQYSVIASQHGSDVAGYFGPKPPNHSPDFEMAFMKIWGNFIVSDDPSIPSDIADGLSSNLTTINPASKWPAFSLEEPYQINLNQTGGVPYSTGGAIRGQNVTQFRDPGLTNAITLVDAYSWEGGRGKRCDFWKELGPLVPE